MIVSGVLGSGPTAGIPFSELVAALKARECNALIRLLLGKLDDITGT